MLQPNHTHFVLVDGEKCKNYGDEIEFRDIFLTELPKLKFHESNYGVQDEVPVVLIVINGGLNTLLTIKNALKNKLPVLILEVNKRIKTLDHSYTYINNK